MGFDKILIIYKINKKIKFFIKFVFIIKGEESLKFVISILF